MADNSIDVVYISHSLEPNGGRKEVAISELLRVARKAVVLVESIYKFLPENAQKRMAENGYVLNLKSTAKKLGATLVNNRLLDVCSNPVNPSGVVLMVKSFSPSRRLGGITGVSWQCPLTGVPLADLGDLCRTGRNCLSRTSRGSITEGKTWGGCNANRSWDNQNLTLWCLTYD
jgi:hypothetical protein